MFRNIFTGRRTLRRCALGATAFALVTTVFQVESQAGPLRRIRRRAARSAYGTGYRTGYPVYTSGYVDSTYYGPSYPMYGPVGGYGPGGAFGPDYYGAYSAGLAAVLPPVGPARDRQYYGAQPLAPPLGDNSPGFAGSLAPRSGPARNPTAGQTSPQATLDNAAFVRQLYRDNLNREPDEAGLNAWVQALDRGMSRRAATNYFLNSRDRAGAPSPNRPAATAGPTLAPPQNGPTLASPQNGTGLAGPENGAPSADFDGNEELPVPPRVANQSNNGPAPRARARNQRQSTDGFEF